MGRRRPTYVPHDPDDPASPLKPHISSTCSSLKELQLSDLLDYKDLDLLVSFDATSVGVRGMTNRTKLTLNIHVTTLATSPLESPSFTAYSIPRDSMYTGLVYSGLCGSSLESLERNGPIPISTCLGLEVPNVIIKKSTPV
jgi:hypothetical protein